MHLSKEFTKGLIHGIPIALGYISVSFGFGIIAVKNGISPFQASLISALNLTSAGQAAGVDVIASKGSLIEMALVQLTINIRYSLMALSLSQKLDKSFTARHRLLASYGITDEIFAVSSSQEELITPVYMYGMILIATLGWVGGTVMGSVAGNLLPASISNAMGVVLYAMFLAIIVPPSRKHRNVLMVVSAAAVISTLLRYTAKGLSSGFAVIISSVIASLAGALLFPVKDSEEVAEP